MKTPLRILSIGLLLVQLSLAGTAQPDSPRRPPNDPGVRYGQGESQRLQLFLPEIKAYPMVIYLYEGPEAPRSVGEFFQRLNMGCALVSPANLPETAQALDYLKREMPPLGGDSSRLFVIGEGHYGQFLALGSSDPGRLGKTPITASLAVAPVLDLKELPRTAVTPLWLLCGPAETQALVAQAADHAIPGQMVSLKDSPTREALVTDNSPVQKALRRFLASYAPPPRAGLAGVKFVQSPNWDVRSLGGNIDVVVLHSTVIETLDGTVKAFLRDQGNRVSAHYVVDRDGQIVQMVDEHFTAWHAGVSELEGRTGLNDFSVGIEIVNRNDGKDPYTDAQYQAIVKIIKHLREHWQISDPRIVSHAQIARPVGRKSDPIGFDFQRLYQLLQK